MTMTMRMKTWYGRDEPDVKMMTMKVMTIEKVRTMKTVMTTSRMTIVRVEDAEDED